MFIVAYSFANPCCNGITMELLAADQKEEDKRRLDPCYNGMTMELYGRLLDIYLCVSLNPCYNGMTMELWNTSTQEETEVLILVIME